MIIKWGECLGKFIDLTGQKFGKLTVKSIGSPYISKTQKSKKIRWVCDCDCGTKNILVIGSQLRSGRTKSCGCIIKEMLTQRNKSKIQYNKYDLSGEYGVGWTNNTNKEFYFDLEDYDKIKDYTWLEEKEGYISTVRDHKIIKFHRLIMNVSEFSVQVDHIHGNGTRNDNRKQNLRIVNNSKNQMNTCTRKDNSSSVKGVSYNKNEQKWRAYIQIDKNNMHLGWFDSFEDAVKARKDAEEKYQGEYSYDNSMKKK